VDGLGGRLRAWPATGHATRHMLAALVYGRPVRRFDTIVCRVLRVGYKVAKRKAPSAVRHDGVSRVEDS
jgi:hypothetical protein